MGGKAARDKGANFEREIVNWHCLRDVPAERIPLSGAVKGNYAGDLKIGPTLGMVLAAKWVFDTFRSLYIPIHEVWINQNIKDSSVRATVISMVGQLDAFGEIVGGPGVGLIGERVAIRAALLVSTALLIPAVPLHTLALRQGRSPEQN